MGLANVYPYIPWQGDTQFGIAIFLRDKDYKNGLAGEGKFRAELNFKKRGIKIIQLFFIMLKQLPITKLGILSE